MFPVSSDYVNTIMLTEETINILASRKNETLIDIYEYYKITGILHKNLFKAKKQKVQDNNDKNKHIKTSPKETNLKEKLLFNDGTEKNFDTEKNDYSDSGLEDLEDDFAALEGIITLT